MTFLRSIICLFYGFYEEFLEIQGLVFWNSQKTFFYSKIQPWHFRPLCTHKQNYISYFISYFSFFVPFDLSIDALFIDKNQTWCHKFYLHEKNIFLLLFSLLLYFLLWFLINFFLLALCLFSLYNTSDNNIFFSFFFSTFISLKCCLFMYISHFIYFFAFLLWCEL